MRFSSNLYWFVIHFDLSCNLHHIKSEVADRLGVVRARLWQAAHRHVFITHCFHLFKEKHFVILHMNDILDCFIFLYFQFM